MPDQQEAVDGSPEHTPDFDLLHYDVIHEDNWAEYQAKGYEPIGDFYPKRLDMMRNVFGAHNLYTGDAWDYDEGRPLRHKPGSSIYTSPEGIRHSAEMSRHE
jgi:hypothetical protein